MSADDIAIITKWREYNFILDVKVEVQNSNGARSKNLGLDQILPGLIDIYFTRNVT